jgi:hypothetical protein
MPIDKACSAGRERASLARFPPTRPLSTYGRAYAHTWFTPPKSRNRLRNFPRPQHAQFSHMARHLTTPTVQSEKSLLTRRCQGRFFPQAQKFFGHHTLIYWSWKPIYKKTFFYLTPVSLVSKKLPPIYYITFFLPCQVRFSDPDSTIPPTRKPHIKRPERAFIFPFHQRARVSCSERKSSRMKSCKETKRR